jgi:hypothetical protein
MTLKNEDLERQLELLALAIYENHPNSLNNWACDYISLLDTVRKKDGVE